MGLLTLFLSCKLKILHDCYFLLIMELLKSFFPISLFFFFFFPRVRSDACIVKGFAASAMVQI